jgi:hypothetical protein
MTPTVTVNSKKREMVILTAYPPSFRASRQRSIACYDFSAEGRIGEI